MRCVSTAEPRHSVGQWGNLTMKIMDRLTDRNLSDHGVIRHVAVKAESRRRDVKAKFARLIRLLVR